MSVPPATMVHSSPDWVVEPAVVGFPISMFPAKAVETKVTARSGAAQIARRVRVTGRLKVAWVAFE